MKKTFAFLCFSFFLQCSYPVKNQENIERDQGFILSKQDDPSSACNKLAIDSAKSGFVEAAELKFDDCIRLFPNQMDLHLNRMRLFYLLEEYETIKGKIVAESPNPKSSLYQSILKSLEDSFRLEERVIVLDALSRLKGWELYSYEELAKYFMNQGNFRQAEFYWNQILEVNAFHEEALYGMVEIQTQFGKWHSVLDYAKSLSVAAKKNKEFHYFYAKAYFELARYEEALKWIEQANANEKSQIAVLEIWRDCLLLTKDKPNWEPLLPFYRKVKSGGYTVPESAFFPTLDPAGRELRKAIRSGRQ